MSQHEQSRSGDSERMPQASSQAPERSEHVERKDEHDAHSGANEPRRVTRGETISTASSSLAHIDWIAFTVRPPQSVEPLPWMANSLESLFGVPVEAWRPSKGGWQCYKHRIDLGDFGLLGYGGESQRGTLHASLNARSCAQVSDWNAVRVWGETYAATLARVDLAHDDFEAETVSIPLALQWFRQGGFSSNGRPATGHLRDDLGSGDGCTLYVGKRENGKLCRVYEKGKQLGKRDSSWCRVEVEIRNKGRIIPWRAVTNPGAYLAGAYPCLAYLSLEQSKIKTTQRAFDMSYEQMRDWVRMAAGHALHTMCDVESGDACAVLDQVMREGRPKRLKGVPSPKPD